MLRRNQGETSFEDLLFASFTIHLFKTKQNVVVVVVKKQNVAVDVDEET